MMEDLKKMETSWCEMENFGQFLKKLLTMNPMQKKLREDMVTSFLRKMASQVKKDNK
jgi:DNA-binding TFAR19-related protein (PDSD5 family)